MKVAWNFHDLFAIFEAYVESAVQTRKRWYIGTTLAWCINMICTCFGLALFGDTVLFVLSSSWDGQLLECKWVCLDGFIVVAVHIACVIGDCVVILNYAMRPVGGNWNQQFERHLLHAGSNLIHLRFDFHKDFQTFELQ